LGPLCKKCFIWPAALVLLLVPCFAQQQESPFTILLHRGFAFHQQADYAHALPLLQQAWKLDPRDYFVNLLLGIDLLRTGKAEKSIGFLTTASRLRPREDFPYEYLGEAQTQLRHFDVAADSLMKAVSVAQDPADATEVWIEFTLERFRQLAGQLRSSQAGLAAEYRLQARSYPAGDKKQRDLLQQSAALDPQAPGILSELALADGAGTGEPAAPTLPNRQVPSPTHSAPPHGDAAAWLKRGIGLAEAAQCHQAIPALELGLAAHAQLVYPQFLLSWCYADEAGKVDAQIRRSGGDQAIAHLIRGDVLFRMQGDTTGAIAEYQAALSLRRNDPKLLERLAEAEVAAGDLTAAQQNAEAALALDTHRYSARQTLARVAVEQGRYADALPLLTLLATQEPHDEGTQISLATTLSQLDRPADALQHLEPVLASGFPDQKGNLHSLLGALLRKTGRPKEAAQAFATARQLSEAYQESAHRDQN
jgi:tetratricopeptide (TPR) repeat protein